MLLTAIPSDVLKNNLLRHVGQKHIQQLLGSNAELLENAKGYENDRLFWKRSVENEFNKGSLLGPDFIDCSESCCDEQEFREVPMNSSWRSEDGYRVNWKHVYELLSLNKGNISGLLCPDEDSEDYVDLAIELGLIIGLWTREIITESSLLYIVASKGHTSVLERLFQQIRIIETQIFAEYHKVPNIRERKFYFDKDGGICINNTGYEGSLIMKNIMISHKLIEAVVINGRLETFRFFMNHEVNKKKGYIFPQVDTISLIDLSIKHEQFHITEELNKISLGDLYKPTLADRCLNYIGYWKYILHKYTDIKCTDIHWIDATYYENMNYQSKSYINYSNMIIRLINAYDIIKDAECKSINPDNEILNRLLLKSIDNKLPSFTLFKYVIEHEALINEKVLLSALELWSTTALDVVSSQLGNYFNDMNRKQQFAELLSELDQFEVTKIVNYLNIQHNIYI